MEKIETFNLDGKKIFENSCQLEIFFRYLSEILSFRHFMSDSKKRVIKSLDNLTDDLRELLKDQYPGGYESSITRITNAKREPIFVFPLETSDSIILVKVPATKNSDGGYDVEQNEEQRENQSNEEDFGSDDSYNSNDEDEDYDDQKSSREASYDPDFDS